MSSQSHIRRPPISSNSQMVQSSVKSWLENAKRDQQLKANSATDSTPSSATAATTTANATNSDTFSSLKAATPTASSAATSTTRPTTSASSSTTSSSSAVNPKKENHQSKAKPMAKPTTSTTTSVKKTSLKDERNKSHSRSTSSVASDKKEKTTSKKSSPVVEKQHKAEHKKQRRAEEKETRDSITVASGGSHQHHHHHHHKQKHHRSKGPDSFSSFVQELSSNTSSTSVTTLDLITVKLPTDIVDFDHKMKEVMDSMGEDSDSSLSSIPIDDDDDEVDLGFLDSESVVDDLIDGMDTGDNSEDEDSVTLEEYVAMVKRLKNVGMDAWIEEMVMNGYTHFRILKMFSPKMAHIVEGFGGKNNCLPMVRRVLEAELKKRRKLENVNTVDDVVELLKKSKNIIVLTGAGISTSLGIPDFRSKDNGLYTKLAHMGLSDPQEVFDIHVFRDDPSIFYQVAKDILPNTTRFSPTHAFIELLQRKGKLLTNYTQNIDNLEFHAGIEKDKLVQCHGSFATATCVKCGHQVPGHEIFPDLRRGRVAKCDACIKRAEQANAALKRKRKRTSEGPRKNKRFAEDSSADEDEGNYYDAGVMKPDITFFGEQLPDRFHDRLTQHDHDKCDLLICIGTSLKVAPVSEVNNFLPPHVPQILISKTPVKHVEFDVKLMGSCDDVVAELSRRSGWETDLKHDMIKEGWEVQVLPVDEETGDPNAQCSTWSFVKKEHKPQRSQPNADEVL